MNAEPRKEHSWLLRLVGAWTYAIEACMKPGEPPQLLTGTETVRSVGGIWIVAEGNGEMPGGGTAQTILTLGFDSRKNRFVGSWIGSMMTHFWSYEGTLDPTEKILTLECEGPTFDGTEALAQYKDVHTLISESERTLTGNVLGSDGKWNAMMTCTYRRAR